jgi:hypothetical protein
MRNLAEAAWLTVMLACCGAIASLSATPPSVPVLVEYETPPPIATGEEATTVLTFRALANLDGLDVSVEAFDGLTIVSEPKKLSFQTVKKGEGRQLTVTVRLTGAKVGSLAVFYTVRRGDHRDSGTTGIGYGAPGH